MLRLSQIWPLQFSSSPFDKSISFLSTPYFVVPQNVLGSSGTFPFLSLQPDISLSSPGSPYWRMVFRSQYLGATCAHCYRGIIAPSLCQRTELHIPASTNIYYLLKYILKTMISLIPVWYHTVHSGLSHSFFCFFSSLRVYSQDTGFQSG